MTTSYRHSRRHGYVLIVTLAVLMLAAASLVSMGRLAMQRSADARAAQNELQRKWGSISARGALLEFVEPILQQQEVAQKKSLPVLRTSLQLGNQRFTFILGDEQAKANLNASLEQLTPAQVENNLRQALSGSGIAAIAIKLRPESYYLHQRKTPATTQSTPSAAPATQSSTQIRQANDQPLTGFGQIFDLGPDRLALPPPRYNVAAPADLITCWGSGAINIRRASAAALRVATSLTPTEIDRIIQSRNASMQAPGTGVTSTVNVMKLLSNTRTSFSSLKDSAPLIDSSTCHSLWIISNDGRRSTYQFVVLDQSDPQHARLESSTW
jgi:hypothetical protein